MTRNYRSLVRTARRSGAVARVAGIGGKVSRVGWRVGKRFLGPLGAALTAYDIAKLSAQYLGRLRKPHSLKVGSVPDSAWNPRKKESLQRL